jgi:hypothetical protein
MESYMPNPSRVSQGNILGQWVLMVTLSPATVAATTSAEQTFTVSGLQLGDMVEVTKTQLQAGLGIGNSRVSAANTLAIQFLNVTNGTLTPAAGETYFVEVTRPENLSSATTVAGSSLSVLT